MCGSIACLAAVMLGVDADWPPLPDGGRQYVMRIERHVLERREPGVDEPVRSYVPPYANDLRAYRIVIGTQGSAKNVSAASDLVPVRTGVDTDWVPLPAGGVECRVWIHPETLDELDKPGRMIEGKIPPAHVEKLSVFTVSVGKNPHPAGGPATDVTTPSVPSGPGILKPDANSAPIPVKPANHVKPSQATPDVRPRAQAGANATAKEPPSAEDTANPWWLPTFLSLGLFASLGGNIFLLWIVRDFRSRYRALLSRMSDAGGSCRELHVGA